MRGNLKYDKKSGTYKGSNVGFNPRTLEAYSYGWWNFTKVMNGCLVFNYYRYSVSTVRHQSKVQELLRNLDIKVDYYVSLEESLDNPSINKMSLDKLIDRSNKQIKARQEERRLAINASAKRRRDLNKKKLLQTPYMFYKEVSKLKGDT